MGECKEEEREGDKREEEFKEEEEGIGSVQMKDLKKEGRRGKENLGKGKERGREKRKEREKRRKRDPVYKEKKYVLQDITSKKEIQTISSSFSLFCTYK